MTLVRPTPPPFEWADPFFTFGVTGTNGKTSTVHMIAAVIAAAGHLPLRISTVDYRLGDVDLKLSHTRKGFFDAFEAARDGGSSWASVEVTSRALADHYAKRWRFDLGVFTNLSPDHLSTHGTYEAYLAAKAQLFVHLGPGRTAVLNAADEHALFIEQSGSKWTVNHRGSIQKVKYNPLASCPARWSRSRRSAKQRHGWRESPITRR